MSSLLDSEAHFEMRAAEVGLSANALSALKGHNLATLGKLAHVVSSPGSVPQPEALADWVRDNLRNASLGDQACVRRLIWEGGALATAELRDQLTNPEGSSQRKVPDAERTKRLQLLKGSLNGIVLEGPLDPSHVLLDKAAGLERDNQLRFLAPEICTSRTWEITHGKPERPVLTFESNKLMVKPHSDVPECHPGSALQLQEALLRRGVALAFAQLVTFPAYQKYVSALFVHFSREPPAGYARCTVGQLARADRLLFERLIEQDLKPRRGSDGKYPLDSALLSGLRDYEVCMALLPLPSSEQIRRPGRREREVNARRTSRDDQTSKMLKGAKGSGKSKGYGKTKGKNNGLCHYCHKPGHFEAQCRKKKWDVEHAKPAAGEKLTESK